MSLLDGLNERQREAVLATEGPVLVLAGRRHGQNARHHLSHRTSARTARAGQRDSCGHVHQQSRQRDERAHQRSCCARADRRLPTCGSPRSTPFARACCAARPRILACRAISPFTTMTIRRLPSSARCCSSICPPTISLRARCARKSATRKITASRRRKCAPTPTRRATKCASRPPKYFAAYNAILRKAAALDFDDLAAALRRASARASPTCARRWSARFQYVMVDEFQDTNASQEELVRLLAGTRKNVCVVGDEDQSIYGWRGARAGNLKRFTEDFPGREDHPPRGKLPLDAEHSRCRRRRGGKQFRPPGQESSGKYRRGQTPAPFSRRRIPSAEAEFICGEISAFMRNEPDAQVAVLYRTGSQSRSFEEILRRMGIRHRVVGGFSFYERAEVRNALAYVRLLFHPEDDVSLLRVLNVPPRGIGAATVALLDARAKETSQSLWDVIRAGELGTGKRLTGALNCVSRNDRRPAAGLPEFAARATDRARARQNRLSRLGRAAGQHRAHLARRQPARTLERHGRSHRRRARRSKTCSITPRS